MKAEERTIQASIYAGATEIIFGVIMWLTGWGTWYFERFHFFGTMGLCMLFYAYWHLYLLRRDREQWK